MEELSIKLVNEVKILTTTDGAGEGGKLQCVRVMVKYDSSYSSGFRYPDVSMRGQRQRNLLIEGIHYGESLELREQLHAWWAGI